MDHLDLNTEFSIFKSAITTYENNFWGDVFYFLVSSMSPNILEVHLRIWDVRVTLFIITSKHARALQQEKKKAIKHLTSLLQLWHSCSSFFDVVSDRQCLHIYYFFYLFYKFKKLYFILSWAWHLLEVNIGNIWQCPIDLYWIKIHLDRLFSFIVRQKNIYS
jgi:hypothetical protein